jgi:hypothetical protein
VPSLFPFDYVGFIGLILLPMALCFSILKHIKLPDPKIQKIDKYSRSLFYHLNCRRAGVSARTQCGFGGGGVGVNCELAKN